MSISSDFNSFSDITQSSKNKKIVLFGAGEIAKKTIQKLKHIAGRVLNKK